MFSFTISRKTNCLSPTLYGRTGEWWGDDEVLALVDGDEEAAVGVAAQSAGGGGGEGGGGRGAATVGGGERRRVRLESLPPERARRATLSSLPFSSCNAAAPAAYS